MEWKGKINSYIDTRGYTMVDKEKEAVKYLQQNSDYKRILKLIFEKYKRLGKFSGTFNLKELTEGERRILAPLNYKHFNAKEAKEDVKKFVQYFCVGRFEGIDFAKVLELYFKKNLITYKEEKEDKSRRKEEFFKKVIFKNKHTRGAVWLNEVLEKKSFGYATIIKSYENYNNIDKLKEFEAFLNTVLKGINLLSFSSNVESLPIFSSKVSKDPHYFDSNTTAGKLLIHSICYVLNKKYPENAEATAEVLYSAGLLKDDISSSTVTFGLKAYRDNKELEFIYSFTEFKEPIILTLGNLAKIDRFCCNKNKLFIFENPSLFSEIVKSLESLKPSIMCTSGQLKLASLVLLDKTIEYVDEVYYSGDFDPEGISIAAKLQERYGDKVKFWRLDLQNYLNAVSDKKISDTSISKLKNIKNHELEELIEGIKKNGVAGYQEALVQYYIEDIKASYKLF